MSEEEFYGVVVFYDEEGRRSYRRCGGYEPQLLTGDQLRPLLELAKESLENERAWPTDSACTAA